MKPGGLRPLGPPIISPHCQKAVDCFIDVARIPSRLARRLVSAELARIFERRAASNHVGDPVSARVHVPRVVRDARHFSERLPQPPELPSLIRKPVSGAMIRGPLRGALNHSS